MQTIDHLDLFHRRHIPKNLTEFLHLEETATMQLSKIDDSHTQECARYSMFIGSVTSKHLPKKFPLPTKDQNMLAIKKNISLEY